MLSYALELRLSNVIFASRLIVRRGPNSLRFPQGVGAGSAPKMLLQARIRLSNYNGTRFA